METLIAILMALGINLATNENGMIVLDSKTMEVLRSEEKYKEQLSSISLDDIVVTDDDDPLSNGEASK